MKRYFSILAVLAVAIAGLHAQGYVQGPSGASLLSGSTAILIPAETTTNLPTTLALQVPVGENGIGFYLRVGATNSVSTTNATIIVEGVVNSQVVDNQTYTLSVPQNGTTGYDYFTNLVNTTANLGNLQSVRIRSIQNTNIASIWITNAYTYTR